MSTTCYTLLAAEAEKDIANAMDKLPILNTIDTHGCIPNAAAGMETAIAALKEFRERLEVSAS